MELLSRLLAGMYFVLPPAWAGWAAWQSRHAPVGRPSRAVFAFMATCFSGSLLGTLLVLVYAYASRAHAPLVQIALGAYVFIGVLCVLKALHWLLREGTERAFVVRVPVSQRGGWWVLRAAVALTIRVVILFCLGLPYVMAVAMVYRPKVVPNDDPKRQLGFAFEDVHLAATDGMPIDAWWIPAMERARPDQPAPPDWGKRTVIVCHGLGANKSNQLVLCRDLVPNGFNVLAIDFRAHGASGGQVSSFGDLERRDVLGAVRWIRQNRPAQSQEIFGVGVSMGGAALLAAAADPSVEGRDIDGIAVYDTFADLRGLLRGLCDEFANPPMTWLATHVALPIASAHAGADLADFSPASDVDALAPRPLLVIHGRGDEIIKFDQGVRLFERASQPKLRLWLGKDDKYGHFFDREGNPADHNGVIFSEDAARTVRLFFEGAHPVL